MSRSRGKRYDEEPKLNMKKVFAFVIAVIVIIMSIVSLIQLLKQGKTNEKFTSANEYLTVYTNEKWGVINGKAELIIPANYSEMIVIPDKTKPVFICTYDVNYTDGTYKTKVLNEKNKEILTKYTQVEAIDNYDSQGNTWYESNILRYKENNKYGLIDFSGKVILKPEYDDIYSLKGIERSIIIEKDGKYGLVNNVTGEIIIEPQYLEILAVGTTYDNGYIVKTEDGEGIIGPDKKVILGTKYENVLNISGNNMYVIEDSKQEKIINSKDEVILDNGFDEVLSIYGENIVAKKDNTCGIIDTKGNIQANFEYEEIEHIFTDYYIAKKNGKYGIISKENGIMMDFTYNSMSYIKSADIIKAEKENYETDLIDRDFSIRLTGIVSEFNTEKGYLRIRKSGEYKYYNFNFEEKTNKDVLTGNTLFLVKNNGKYGYENKNGELIVDYIYDDATEQNKYGFCSVKKDGLWGCLKSDGSVVVKPSKDLSNNLYIDFIGEWYLYEDLNLNVYTK